MIFLFIYSTGYRFEPTYKELKQVHLQIGLWGYQLRFEPTYKELKPLSKKTVSLKPHKGFEPTYKELKQLIIQERMTNIIGFEPTYKELKLSLSYYL